MDERTNPLVRFIAEMSKPIFERSMRGEIDYDNDLKALQKHLEMARQAKAPLEEARVINLIAVLNSMSGHLTLAEEQFTKLFTHNQTMGNKFGMVTALNNKAFFLTSLGRYEEASLLYQQGIEFCELAIKETLKSYILVLSGQLAVCYMLGDYDKMPSYFEKIRSVEDDLLSKFSSHYAVVMSEVYRSMAEYHLHRKDYDEATSMSRIGIDFAKRLSLTFELADLYYTQAHIALAQGDKTLAETYWAKAIDILDKVPAKSSVGRNYAQEARYLERRGYMEYGRRFAQYAQDIFESLNMPEDIQLTQVLLN
mgnify:CR=1 FL=1